MLGSLTNVLAQHTNSAVFLEAKLCLFVLSPELAFFATTLLAVNPNCGPNAIKPRFKQESHCIVVQNI